MLHGVFILSGSTFDWQQRCGEFFVVHLNAPRSHPFFEVRLEPWYKNLFRGKKFLICFSNKKLRCMFKVQFHLLLRQKWAQGCEIVQWVGAREWVLAHLRLQTELQGPFFSSRGGELHATLAKTWGRLFHCDRGCHPRGGYAVQVSSKQNVVTLFPSVEVPSAGPTPPAIVTP